MSEDFVTAVEDGLRLSKRIYFGRDRSVAPPKQEPGMSKSSESYLPTAPMVYAVISDPAIVDNPDIPSYQPHVYGRCDPPALIPLQMNGIALEVECLLDTAFVRVSGSWRVHCVMGSKSCDCRIAVPLGEQGSILGVEVEVPRKSYRTQLVAAKEKKDVEKVSGVADGGYLKPYLFVLTIPQVDGGTNLSIKISWTQKLLFHKGEFILRVPFSFPEYVVPAAKKIPKKEKIQLTVNSGEGSEVLCKTNSHPLKERVRQAGRLSFLYESKVLRWSSVDFSFSYTVPSSHISGSVLLQSPSVDDVDQREMFCMHILPGSQENKKVFARNIVYVVDISGSMQGKLLEDVKNALSTALSQLNPEDSFNIIAFNRGTFTFSSSLKSATKEEIENAIQWIGVNFVIGDGTGIFLALNQALDVLSNRQDSMPIIFLITDGASDDERYICDTAKRHLANWDSICPRIHTFGIGQFCNHYFLQMLSIIGRGHYDAAHETDSIELCLSKLFSRASSAVFANIAIGSLDELDEVEVYPIHIPDLSSESPMVISGRYRGRFPEVLKASGIAADMTSFTIELKVQKAKDTSLDRVVAMQQISMWTAQAWFSEDKHLEEKVAKLSTVTGIVSEYTLMNLVESEIGKNSAEVEGSEVSDKGSSEKVGPNAERTRVLRHLGLGFGNLKATAENLVPGSKEAKLPEAAEIIMKATSDCCGKVFGWRALPLLVSAASSAVSRYAAQGMMAIEERDLILYLCYSSPIGYFSVSISFGNVYDSCLIRLFTSIIMKIFSWAQNKFNGSQGSKKENFNPIINETPRGRHREEFSDWPHGLLAIGTFGNKAREEDPEETGQLQNELNGLFAPESVSAKSISSIEQEHTDFPVDKFLHCEVSSTAEKNHEQSSGNNTNQEGTGHLQSNSGVVHSEGRDFCLEKSNNAIRKKSLSFLLKKMFLCRSEFLPARSPRDPLAYPESRIEKILRAILHKKIYPQSSSPTASTKKYLESSHISRAKTADDHNGDGDEDDNYNEIHKGHDGSKWVNSDTEYIVLEILSAASSLYRRS
ncbi:hypothetical protein Nepgr_025151 [Nepenthes gracilis]|uniref:VWFA domain-containing protein n=1 Tax=Nepenthes gracilis TaxID=150966 RepID=A0AAD3XZF2_NEPGR|nr:hypothetical protein Nepgr_025151 [Nepenthes gracilis]